MKNPIIPGLDITARSIFCIGRNYVAHAKEMGHAPPSQPMVFLKALNTICFTESEISLPSLSNNVHHELELVLAIGKSGKNIDEKDALNHIVGYGIGIDFTARDIQKEAKSKGHPWSVAKGYDDFAPIGNFIPFDSLDFPELSIQLSVNGEIRQSGTTSDMIFNVAYLISYLSTIFTLEEGDLIFTGTPEGVSAIKSGDVINAKINDDLSSLTITIK